MKTQKFLALLLAVLMTALIAGCGQTASPASPSASEPASAAPSESPSPSPSEAASPSPEDTSITVTDMTGKTITLDKPAEKVVAITASDCEILFAIGAGDTVIGRGKYCDYPAEVAEIPAVQSGQDMNIEQIIALTPEVVIMSTMAQTEDQVASLESAGIKVIATDADNIEGTYTAITLIGQVVGKNDEAKAVIDSMKATFEDLKAKVTAESGKTIYFEISPLEYGLYAAGSGTFMDELAAMLGIKNIFGDMPGWLQVSEEQVIQLNPDYIITSTMAHEGAPNPIDEIMSRPGWEGITAIKDGTIYNTEDNAFMRPGPRLAIAAQELYDFVYGG